MSGRINDHTEPYATANSHPGILRALAIALRHTGSLQVKKAPIIEGLWPYNTLCLPGNILYVRYKGPIFLVGLEGHCDLLVDIK